MIVPPPPVVVQVQPPPRRTARGPVVVLVVLAVLVAAAAGMLVAREMSAPTNVALEPVATAGADPFMPAVGTDALSVQPVAHTGGRRSGTTPGLYGGSGSDAACDRGRLSRFLADHPDRAAGWASVLGLGDSSSTTVSRYVEGLTSVVLRSDTYVTNHGWANGRVTSWPAVLQAGTAVLVDDHGNPVTRCFCGNPLSAPRSFSSVAYYGPRWVSFTSNAITVITHQTTTVTNNYTIVDVHTGRGWDRPVGSDGHHDTVNLNVTINDNYFPPPETPSRAEGQPQDQPAQDQPPQDQDQQSGDEPAPLVAQAPVDAGSGTTPDPTNSETEGAPGQPETTSADTTTTTSTTTTTTTTEPTADAPSGTYSASGCFGGGAVTLSGGTVTVDGVAAGSYTFSGSTLRMVPEDGSPVTLTNARGTWSGDGCALTGGNR